MDKVNLYVKTTLRGQRKGAGAFLYLLEAEGARGTVTRDRLAVLDETTENKATLEAVDEALGRIKRPVELEVWMDCEYVAAMIENGWPEKWEKAGWINSKGKQVTDWEKWSSVLGRIRLHAYRIHMGEHHAYAKWMEDKLKKAEVALVQQKGAANV